MKRYFLGVDGGQSSTTALIGDESGRVVGSGRGGPCNHVGAAEGRQKFISAMDLCIASACRHAGLDPEEVEFEAACLGFSGGPADKVRILREILRTGRLIVTDDALIALAGATAGEAGIITIAGTGSIAFGRNAAGKTARAGGWGYIYGDEGGGFDLVRRALRAALQFEEGWGPETALHSMLLEATGATSANDLLHRFYTSEFSRPRIAGFARLVDEAALNGDSVARDILSSAAQQLAALAAAVRRQLFVEGETARVTYIGGVFLSRMLLERFRMLIELEGGNRCSAPIHGPAAGALLEAYRSVQLRPQLRGLPEWEK
jgi:N-acetylglucosamine kinase-like BadF-type ATPase